MRVISEIKMLYNLSKEEQLEKLDKLYPCQSKEKNDILPDNILDTLVQGFNK